MRIKCEFKTDKIPVANQMQVVSLIKESIKAVDYSYYKELYEFGDDKKNKKTKDFSFALYMKEFRKEDDEFIINDKVIINFTSPDYNFMVKLYNGIMEKKNFEYKEYSLKNIKISMIHEKNVNENKGIFTTLSPIAIKNRNNEFIDITNENYENELNYIIEKSLQNARGYGLKERIKFTPISMKKVVVKEEIGGFKKLNNNRYLFVNAYRGTFKLEGQKEDLNLIYQLGIGFKRNQGFGMINIVD